MKTIYNYIFGLLFIASFSYGVNKTGTTAAKFLSINVGSHAVGMGGAFTSIANDATAMYWNPAGLSYYNTKEVYLNHSKWIADISFDYFGVTMPFRRSQVIGLSITSVTMADMEVTRYGNEDTGELFSAADYAVGLTYAIKLTNRFSIGFNGKYIQETIANNHAKGMAVDMGTLFTTPYGFRLGTSINNFGPKMKMTGDDLLIPVDVNETIDGNNESVTGYLSTDYFDLPLLLRVGISDDLYFGNLGRLTWSFDVNSPNDNSMYINMGTEIGLLNNLFVIRVGANSLFMNDREKVFSLGCGIKSLGIFNKTIHIDYGYESLLHLGDFHQLSIHIRTL